MKRFIGSTLALLLLVGTTLRAQRATFADYLSKYDLGVGVEMIVLDERPIFNGVEIPNRYHRETAVTLSAGISWYFPVVEISDAISAGILPAFNLVVAPTAESSSPSFTNDQDLDGVPDDQEGRSGFGLLNVPLFVAIKFGGDAHYDPVSKIGGTLGIGYQGGWLMGSSFFYGLPAVTAEVGFDVGKRIAKIRYTRALGSVDLTEELHATQHNLSLFFTFD